MNRHLITTRYLPTAAGVDDCTVTVVITCYNYARYLPQAVTSVLTQTGVAVDVVVVDDASTDESLAVAHRFAAGDSRVKVISNEHNLGAVGAFNRGLDQAAGEFLVRLDADDLLTPGSLERSVAVLRAFPEVGLVYGHPLHFSGTVLPPARTAARWWDVWSGREWLAARCFDGTNVITSPEVVMRRSVLGRIGGMKPLTHTHDMELWLRIAAHADVAYVGGADQAWHRDHPASLSTKAEHPLIILSELRAAFDELFGTLGAGYPGGAVLHRHARRAVSNQALMQALRMLDRGQAIDLVEDLRGFALDTDPAITSIPLWRQIENHRARALPPILVAAAGTLPRLRRRATTRMRMRRWHRNGVYEPIRVAAGHGQLPSRPGSTTKVTRPKVSAS